MHALTNVSFYLYKLRGVSKVGKRGMSEFPSYLLQNKHLLSLLKDPRTGRPYNDNMCFFRCLALAKACACVINCKCKLPKQRSVDELFRQYEEFTGLNKQCFAGISETDLIDLELMFDVSITVFNLKPDGACDIVWRSKRPGSLKLNMNLHGEHFSYVRDVDRFCRSFKCLVCDAHFTRATNAKRHTCDVNKVTNMKYSNGIFKPPATVWDLVELETGICVPQTLRFYPYWMTYDIESLLLKEDLPPATTTTTFHSQHQLVSVSVCSNIPEFDKPVCFVRHSTVDECVERFVAYVELAAMKAEELLVPKYKYIRAKIRSFVKSREQAESQFAEAKFSSSAMYKSRVALCGLQEKITSWIQQVPLVSFNGQNYDLHVMKAALVKCFCDVDEEGNEETSIQHVVKKQEAMACITTDRLRIVDMVNIIGPGYTYDRYLKAFGVTQAKGFFPYEWLDCLSKLKERSLPPIDAFYSRLKGKTITDDEYEVVRAAWQTHNMETVEDLLIWYNNLDVDPFVEAIGKQTAVYQQNGIDMLKDAFSAPGISVLWLEKETGPRKTLRKAFEDTSNELTFYQRVSAATADVQRIHKFDDDRGPELYKLFRENLVGGPSIVFHREHEKGVTRLRHMELGAEAELCDVILGLDANALYLHCIMQEMPVGMPRVRLAENSFSIESGKSRYGKTAQGWLAWMEFQDNVCIETAINGGERRVGQHGLPVDGFCQVTWTIYQFHGCHWHGHDCDNVEETLIRGLSNQARREETAKKERYLRQLGYRLVSIWECEWSSRVKASTQIRSFLSSFFAKTYGQRRDGIPVEEILQRVRDDSLFGFVECDIHVPQDKWEYFKEMSPIFKNIELCRENLSPHMRQFAEEENFLKRPQRYLVGSMKGEKILLLTKLLRWYMDKGLVVTKVHRVVEYEKKALFKKFGMSVTEARRLGDCDPTQKLVADTNKLIGNSAYGKLCQDKSKHKNVTYSTSGSKASEAVRSGFFHSLNVLDSEVFEISAFKRIVCALSLSSLADLSV